MMKRSGKGDSGRQQEGHLSNPVFQENGGKQGPSRKLREAIEEPAAQMGLATQNDTQGEKRR